MRSTAHRRTIALDGTVSDDRIPMSAADPEPADRRRAALPLRKKVAFALIPLALVLVGGEIIARAVRGPLYFQSFRLMRIDQLKRGYPAVRDPQLGYVPKAGYATDDSRWGTTITIDADGMRSNGQPHPDGPAIVAVGDSFTFGDEVSDSESWPAALERVLDQPVFNGGVFGYSFAQAVLRGERILAKLPAQWLVLSLIPDDLRRCEYSKRYTMLPWFEIRDGALLLHEPPAEESVDEATRRERALKNLLGYSALMDAVLANTVTDWWVSNEKTERALPIGTGAKVGLLLVDRIAAFCKDHHCRLLVVLQGIGSNPNALAVLQRARDDGQHALDLTAAFRAEYAKDDSLKDRYFQGHMTAEGNQWAAETIAEALRAAR